MRYLIETTLTDNCNKSCSYCFENHLPAKRCSSCQAWDGFITDFCEDVSKGHVPSCDGITIDFWGGEPFLETEKMLDLVAKTSKYKFVDYHVYTNGTLPDRISGFI